VAISQHGWVPITQGVERKAILMSIPATMRALQQTSVNGPQDLRLIADAPVPVPGPGEVLIRVTAAGVNFGDISQARGTFLGGPQPPYLAGFEAAGEIAAIGEAVTGMEPGARVVGVGIGGGAFAEYMVLPAAAALPVPAGWADEQALGLVVNWPTALAALRPLGCIAAGQTVLIHAAAGGTGQAAVTMAKHLRRDSDRNRLAGQARDSASTGRRPCPRLPRRRPRH
jgi:NADPH:quinone reductase